MKKFIFLTFSIIFIISLVGIWSIVSKGYDKQNKIIINLKKIIPSKVAKKIRDTIFFIPNLENRNKFLEVQLAKYEQGLNGQLYVEKNYNDEDVYNYSLKSFFLPFPSLDLSLGWKSSKNYKRAHYLEIIENKVLVISGEGETIYFERKNINNKQLDFKKISNNLEKILSDRGSELKAIRDLYFEDDFIYISVFEQKEKKGYFNIYRAVKNFKNLDFKIFFENKEYIDGGFNLQTGGRLTGYKSNEILFSVGFFGDYEAPQNIDSTFGKIISINKDTKDYKVVSMGHRNPQGLFFSKEKNIIINTEHGPKGGDEVNFNFLNNSKILNYGWPISSYGEPYPQQDKNFFIKNGFLKKNHSDYNFEEPIKYFTPSIGISEVTFVNNKLYISSLRAESIYIIELSKDYKINKQKRLKFESRIRDLKYDNENKVFLILFENVPSIGVLKFN